MLSVGGYKQDGVETHLILLGAGLWIIEGLNLGAVKPGTYELVCLPLRIVGADGAPARAILRSRGHRERKEGKKQRKKDKHGKGRK